KHQAVHFSTGTAVHFSPGTYTHNIGQGDAVCEEFMKRGRKTEVPENLVGLINKYESFKR
ncbi:MAG: hypothetical protein J7L96_07930, partial [Bacteroidales bacterium]|nr:hypothetical protein [Bacteroidales bacterium]